MKRYLTLLSLLATITVSAQMPVDLSGFNKKSTTVVSVNNNVLDIRWVVGNSQKALLKLNLENGKPLFQSVQMSSQGKFREIAKDLDPSFIVTVGKRDLVSQNGWNIFFDRVPLKPFQCYVASIDKKKASVVSEGSRTVIKVSQIQAEHFTGDIQLTLYNGSPLFNIAAVMATDVDSTAVIYDAGLVSKSFDWQKLVWSDPLNNLQTITPERQSPGTDLAVKYRAIV